ncbi:HEPN domain-containing protein [Laspinema olomoucense]|uniref:HEPN domain-containing protein n=1 Tax=Laspinema olomoucense TaxID=3231600 RepID=UPI0021BA77A3|nr:HEPN domain-containing protein [Laspinema sp. D3d]MCT7975228.1 hypothetical protein [Laspinema sp. D3d]
MSIKLKTQKSIEKKLSSLINQGKQLTPRFLEEEYRENCKNLSGAYDYEECDISNLAEPAHYSDLLYELIKWQKQCLHLLEKLPLENTVYSNVLELLKGKKDKKGREIYLAGIDIQEITLNLEAILEDLKDGLFENLFLAIEVQSALNHLEQAHELFDDDQYILAGLVSLCSLESLLTELYRENLKDEIMLDDLVKKSNLIRKSNFLKGKGVISKSTSEDINKLADIRNSLAHGDSKLVSKDEVRKVISQVQFLVRSLMPND